MLGKSAGSNAEPRKDQRPNILFIMTDQQSATMMSCTGNPWLKTPALDRLAASGVRFERAYASNPVCVPSRFSLQTGLMPSAIGMGRNEDSKASTVTDAMIHNAMGNVFKRAGYETVYGGKLHMPTKMDNMARLGFQKLTRDARQDLAEACTSYLHEKHEKPFLLFASFINPHDICYMALNDHFRSQEKEIINNLDSRICEEVVDRVRNASDDKTAMPPLPDNHAIPEKEPQSVTTNYTQLRPFREHVRRNWSDTDWRQHRWTYCRLTEMVDAKIGQVLKALESAGLTENTLVVFTSDHGDMDSAHKMEHKSILYEESVRIPYIMSFPGKIPSNVIDDTHLISNGLDLLPTLCDYAEIEPPPGLAGKSVRKLAEGEPEKEWRDHLFAESQSSRMVRTERYKYVIYESGANREFLIDMEKDLGEMNNLAEDPQYAKTVEQHRKLLKDWIIESDDQIGMGYV